MGSLGVYASFPFVHLLTLALFAENESSRFQILKFGGAVARWWPPADLSIDFVKSGPSDDTLTKTEKSM